MAGTSETSAAAERRLNLSRELEGVKGGLMAVAEAVMSAFPEDRVKEIVAYEQRRNRRQMVAVILLPILVALLFVFVQAEDNADTLSEAKVTADFVRDCLQRPDFLTPEERVERCGPQGRGTGPAIKALIEFNKCALLIRPEARTDDNMNACATRALTALAGG